MNRSRPALAVDLKHPGGAGLVLRLCESADVLFEGFRPGAMERLGLGPEACLARRPALVYGRMTGWGQDGPLAGDAGHDTNYLALTGEGLKISGDAKIERLTARPPRSGVGSPSMETISSFVSRRLSAT